MEKELYVLLLTTTKEREVKNQNVVLIQTNQILMNMVFSCQLYAVCQ